jgi:hypothetical protein
MKKVNYVFFTEVITILSEKGEEKVKKATSKSSDSEYDLDFYDKLGMKPPKELLNEENLISEDGFMKLEEGEFTYDFQNRFLDMTDFSTAVEAEEFGTLIQFKDGREYFVEEDIFEVYGRIKVAQMTPFEVFKESVIYFFGEIKNKLTRNKLKST